MNYVMFNLTMLDKLFIINQSSWVIKSFLIISFIIIYIQSAMKFICMQCWLWIYYLTIVKFKDYQKFERHQCVAWLQSAVCWLHAKFSWFHRHW